MIIELFKTQTDSNHLTKVLENPAPLTGTMRGVVDLINPIVTVELAQDNPARYSNYAYISEFDRYYYISKVVTVRNNLYELHLTVDVLMSYAEQILQLNCIISKSTDNGSRYLPNDAFKTLVKNKTDVLQFPNGLLESGEFILITAGG